MKVYDSLGELLNRIGQQYQEWGNKGFATLTDVSSEGGVHLLPKEQFLALHDMDVLRIQGYAIMMLFVSNISLIVLLWFLFRSGKSGQRNGVDRASFVGREDEFTGNGWSSYLPQGNDKLRIEFDYDFQDQQEKRKQHMLQMNLRADDKWVIFKKWFNEIYPDFYPVLTERYPDLTQCELRLLSLMKFKLNNKEMALRLGISMEGVKKSKQRLRKKTSIDLDELVA
ncbi:helix-turn-helix transcriptional regulator [Sphingobacterium psychroaquaticum]|uniref:helix-turn-helix transcriptional regulator n=1 Tax=Sphingobacterium psychroaquaticum TaxID=561061 RepID=UPI00106977D0|nr:helix-turn-helix transcriptional regulator [Sphingobacterium psychroaquaticum]QBQ41257.1 helix-turn-helix transcriptional regulator [Sphingobacterium psychroaquaticum]